MEVMVKKINIILALFCLSSFNLEIKSLYIPDYDDEIEDIEADIEAKEEESSKIECPTNEQISRLIKGINKDIKDLIDEAKEIIKNSTLRRRCLTSASIYLLMYALEEHAARLASKSFPHIGTPDEMSNFLSDYPD